MCVAPMLGTMATYLGVNTSPATVRCLSFTFRLHSAARSSGRRGADDTVLHQLSSGGVAAEGIRHSSPTVIINQERRRGHLCSTISQAIKCLYFTKECLSGASRKHAPNAAVGGWALQPAVLSWTRSGPAAFLRVITAPVLCSHLAIKLLMDSSKEA